MPTTRKRWYHGAVKRLAASRPGSWLLMKTVPGLDRWMMRRSNGQRSFSSALAGLDVVTLKTVGAKSGEERSTPILAIPDGANYLLIASNFGQAKNPSWYYNLSAHPRARLVIGETTHELVARELHGEERERAWQRAVDLYAGYTAYARRTDRVIPVFVLEPASDG